MDAVTEPAAALAATAATLAGTPVSRLVPVLGGANNRLFRVETADGGSFALKTYLRLAQDPRDRLGAEFTGLRFIWERGIRTVPRAVAADAALGCALFGWVEGAPVTRPGAAEVDAAVAFLASLRRLAADPAAAMLPLASEACLSAGEVVAQIERRLARLQAQSAGKPALAQFLRHHFEDAFTRYAGAALTGYRAAGLNFHDDLAANAWTLSPSDFGFHNTLRGGDGALTFLDFEYFGWDDPVKLVADFLLHPGMRLDAPLQRRFLRGATQALASDAGFALRLRLLYPLFGLRWVLICLNEFLPERWLRRAYAGQAEREAAEARQLAKAQDLLWRLAACDGGYPYDA